MHSQALKRLMRSSDNLKVMTEQNVNMINDLIDVISKEAAIFESFLELLEEQQQMLVKNDVEGLNRITDLQRERLVQSQLLNKRRSEIIEAVKVGNRIEDDLNVTRLLEIVDQAQADRLVKLQQLILSLNEKINETRDQNAMLLNRSREYIHKTLEMLSRVNSPDAAYGPDRRPPENHTAVAIDRRI